GRGPGPWATPPVAALRSPDRLEVDPVTRPEAGRRVLNRVEEGELGASDEVPSTRTLHGVDPGLPAGDPDRAGGDRRPRGGQARGGQRRRHLTAVSEAGSETDRIHEVIPLGMGLDHLADADPGARGDPAQV